MKVFVSNLEKEITGRLKKIELSDLNILKKSLEASLVLGDAFQQLREFIDSHIFNNEAEEIEFFKVIKPRLYHRLLYYRKVYNIEMNRPVGVDSKSIFDRRDKSNQPLQYQTLRFRALLSFRHDALGFVVLSTQSDECITLPRIIPLRTRPEIFY